MKRSSVESLLAAGTPCFGYHVNGKAYQGRVSETATGKPCQRWDAQQPHGHSVVAEDMPGDSLGDAANYCRNHIMMPYGLGVIQLLARNGNIVLR